MSEEEEVMLTVDDFIITPDFSAETYEKDEWGDRLISIEDHDEREKIFDKLYKHIWNLLFGPNANEASRSKAISLLVVERPDAAFINPFAYNDWIRTVKDEIIKQKLSDLWYKEFVAKDLGLIWAKHSDYFDDMEDPEPVEFYRLNGFEPPVASLS